MSANAAQTQDQDTAKTEKSGGGGDVTHDVIHSHVSSHVSKDVYSQRRVVLDLLFTARWGWADLYAMYGNCTVQYTVECDE